MPIAGRISMNFTSVDVGDSPIEIGDEVILFGEGQGDARVTVEEAAAAAGTIAYELLVRVGRRVPRQFED
jgi:alanine racemase